MITQPDTPRGPFICLALTLIGLIANHRVEYVDDVPPPIAEEFPAWRDLVEKLAASPCELERRSIFLGTVCEEFEQ